MTLKDNIRNFIANHGVVTLKDIYNNFPNPRHSIRARLSELIKDNQIVRMTTKRSKEPRFSAIKLRYQYAIVYEITYGRLKGKAEYTQFVLKGVIVKSKITEQDILELKTSVNNLSFKVLDDIELHLIQAHNASWINQYATERYSTEELPTEMSILVPDTWEIKLWHDIDNVGINGILEEVTTYEER